MATIDTSIYNQQPAVRLQTPFEIQAGMQAIQQGRDQNRLAQMQFAEAERKTDRGNALSGITRQYGNTPEYGNRLMDGGFAQEAQAQEDYVQKRATGASALKTSELAQEKARVSAGLEQFAAIEQIMSGVRDQGGYDVARQDIERILGPEAASRIPPVYNPQVIADGKAKAMDMKGRLEQRWKELDAGSRERDFLQKTDEFAYRQQNDSANRAQQKESSIRTDSRARDFNATKVEENTLKREAKADTANLTKQSQLASFDTMISTLDRMGTHPGLSNATGMMNYLPDRKGSDVSNFKAELYAFQSQAFIPMVSQLKGMGALSDAEGKKLTAAVGALDVDKMSESAVRESITRIIADMKAAKDRVSGNQSNQQEGKTAMSKSGKPMIMNNGRWEYK